MDEQTEIKDTEKETPTEDTGEGVKSETDKKIEQLDAKTERIKKALAEAEQAKAEAKLAGVTDAVEQPPVEKKEETPVEYKDRILREGV